ncbi:MAG: ATP-binding protein, partial [Alphaproteobacteria bacterium]|nr:ATP-binding protein [Alphaproteobacteria bacterium]
MRRAASLRLRLVGGAALWIVAALLAAGAVLAGIFADHVQRQRETEIASHLDQLAAVAEWRADGPALRHDLADPRFQRPYSGLYWQIEATGRADSRSRSLWDEALAVPP